MDLLYGKLSRFLAHTIDDDNIHSYLIFLFVAYTVRFLICSTELKMLKKHWKSETNNTYIARIRLHSRVALTSRCKRAREADSFKIVNGRISWIILQSAP